LPCNHVTPRSAGFVCAAARSQPCAPPRSAEVARRALSHPHQPRDRPARHARSNASRAGCAPAASPPQTWRGTYPPAPDLPRFESCLAPAPSSFQPCRACPSTDGAEPASNTPPNSMCTLLLDHMGNFGVRNNQVNTVELSVPRHLQASQNPVESAQEPGARRAPSYFGTLIGRPITVVMGTGCGSTPICPNRPAGPRRARKRRPTTYPAAWLHRRHVAVNTFTAETAVPSPYTSGTTKPAAFFVKRWNCIRVGMPQQAHSSHCGTCLKPTAR